MWSIRQISAAGLTYRHYARYRQILTILIKYGFEDALGFFHLDRLISNLGNLVSRRRRSFLKRYSRFERVRMALEELGPTFIKLGQALSMRPDLVSVDLVNELAKLQDRVPPFPFTEVRSIVESEFNRSLPELFDHFEDVPLASASIGQVHKARLRDGREAAVKVQRPGLQQQVAVDIGIMYHLASMMEGRIEEFSFIRPAQIVEEFARTIARELDYNIEADHMERFASDFAGDPTLHIPKAYRDLTTRRVLTMEFIDGIKISDIASLDRAQIDKTLIIRRGATILLKQIFDHGFFHADPHSGNIYILPDQVIAMLDFGMVGSVDQESREDFVDLINSVIHQNALMVTRKLLKITFWEIRPDTRLLEKEVAGFIGKYFYKVLKDLDIGQLLQDLLHLVSRFRLRVPPDIFLMMKALATIEGIARQLDPDFDMIKQTTPFIRQIRLERITPRRLAGEVSSVSGDLVAFVRQFPSDMIEISRIILKQQMSVQINEKTMEKVHLTHNRIGNRISIAIIIAALVMGAALLIASKTPPLWGQISIFGLACLFLAAVFGLWLMSAVLRRGRL